jgi:predicted DsbA family dithiol-disulfide isomerase
VTDPTNTSSPSAAAPIQGIPIKVDVWSDIACPWCYIGKRKFEDAAARFDGEVEVVYHSFELSPDTPVDFEGDEVDFLAKHKGMPADQVRGMLDHVAGVAAEVGLEYDFGSLHHTNTVKAHQLLHFAKARGLQLEMTERLLAAYFVEGRHVGRVGDLGDLAAEVGLDRAEVVEALEADRHLADVRADQQQAQSFGITGVPFFVLEGKYGISGAQAPEAFLGALQQVQSELAATSGATPSASGEATTTAQAGR